MVTVKSTHLSKGNSNLSNSVEGRNFEAIFYHMIRGPRHPCAKPTISDMEK
ncbi:hypothetical protein GYH30_055858 [Glycine max]|nr:hypothetical protein GYH30_055858 [Glycine max]